MADPSSGDKGDYTPYARHLLPADPLQRVPLAPEGYPPGDPQLFARTFETPGPPAYYGHHVPTTWPQRVQLRGTDSSEQQQDSSSTAAALKGVAGISMATRVLPPHGAPASGAARFAMSASGAYETYDARAGHLYGQ